MLRIPDIQAIRWATAWLQQEENTPMTTLYVLATQQTSYDPDNNVQIFQLVWSVPDSINNVPFTRDYYVLGSTDNPSTSPYPTFVSEASAVAYLGGIHGPSFVSSINAALGMTFYTSYDVELIPSPVKVAIGALNFSLYSQKSNFAALTALAPHGISNAATNAPTNSPDNSPTNLNVVTTLLGSLVGQVNSTNANQNQIADNCNATASNLNALATAFNNLLTWLGTSRAEINATIAAGAA